MQHIVCIVNQLALMVIGRSFIVRSLKLVYLLYNSGTFCVSTYTIISILLAHEDESEM